MSLVVKKRELMEAVQFVVKARDPDPVQIARAIAALGAVIADLMDDDSLLLMLARSKSKVEIA